jgi:hypothetical protein
MTRRPRPWQFALAAAVVVAIAAGRDLTAQDPARVTKPIRPDVFTLGPVQVTMAGTAFTPEGRDVTIQDESGRRHFRGKPFAKVMLRATLVMPAATAAEFKMQRLAVHFRTSRGGPTLRAVELRNGANTAFRLETQVGGDYTAREITTPETAANAWDWKNDPVRVSGQSVLRLEVQFPGGIDSQINPGEFVLTNVQVDYPRKPPGK